MKSARLRVLFAALALVAMLAFAACGETKDDEPSSSSGGGQESESPDGGADPSAPLKTGLNTVSIPKQLGNPYEEFEHSGVDEALKELGGANKITGPTDAGASSQISLINAAVQQKADAIIIAGNDPNAVAPALKQAAERGIKVVGMDSDVAPDARSVFVNQVTTAARGREPGRVDRRADRLQGRDRDPLGDRQRHEPERLDRRDEGDAQAGQVQGHEARQDRLRRRRRPEVLPGDAGPDPGLSRTSRASSRRPPSAWRPPRATCRRRRRRARSS